MFPALDLSERAGRAPCATWAGALQRDTRNSRIVRGMAERGGFEPPCRLPDKTLSRRPRYDHFGTSPHELFIIPENRPSPASPLPVEWPVVPVKGLRFGARDLAKQGDAMSSEPKGTASMRPIRTFLKVGT